ncbi:MAG TPA: M14 family metallopeptidase [Candidatus Paceibacterota bacterium]|nr:M14 family metallopeptidase [Candidatus Paceibacterota bacterium]HRZ34453.1 M14 family metallopeptidase [Candidatus Paceibacterota bacterium]
MKKVIIIITVVILVGLGLYYLINLSSEALQSPDEYRADESEQKNATSTDQVTEPTNGAKTIIGTSADGLDIVAYHFGRGEKEILFIGGIHGGYSWNSSLVAYNLIDHLSENPPLALEAVKVTIIPVLNPDGLSKVVENEGPFEASDISLSLSETIPGRFNGNEVDLNRNFDCDWQSAATWQNKSVSGGNSAFSEPESAALKNYVEANKPTAVISWDSAAGGVFASSCHNGVSAETLNLVNLYAEASGYKAYKDFDFYEITGDMVNWLAKNDIPAIGVLLTSHNDAEWTKNLAGIEAVLEYYTD